MTEIYADEFQMLDGKGESVDVEKDADNLSEPVKTATAKSES